ncbi:Death executioner caspase related to Apopain/Yama [Carabus blaptoides fortunei]
MSVNNNFRDNSQVTTFTQHNSSRSESNEERKKDKPKLDESTSSTGSYNPIPQYDIDKRGLVVTFNQENFLDGTKERVGTMQDVKALEKCFSDKRHFEFNCEKDLTKELVQEEIASVATRKKYKDYSYVIIIFLSHGDAGGRIKLSGDDDITNEEIWQPFCSADSIWRNKPKLFIFQACKGSEFTFIDNLNIDIGKKHQMVPKEADILVGYSTVEGNVSIRTPDGTWYIQNLCKIINEYGKREDILDILTRVNHEIAHNCEAPGSCIRNVPNDKTIKQMPMFLSTLTKKFYFYSQANRI